VGLLLFAATFVSWFCAGKIAAAQAKEKMHAANSAAQTKETTHAANPAAQTKETTHAATLKRFWLVLGVTAPLACLFFFKYMGFFGQMTDSVFGLFFRESTSLLGGKSTDFSLDILLPAGISFYTFQTLSYVIDVYRKNLAHERHFGYYALYVSFFPQLVAGPIERPGNLLPQLKKENAFYPQHLFPGFCQILTGFFKKLVVADYLARFVDASFAAPELVQGPGVALAAFLFAVQIYCDFSGYCDIATGVAGMLGIRLMKNFNHPYLAGSVREFWHRWHVSLTSWFTDYIYIPLGGSRKGIRRQICNVLIVFFISGLWHGAAWHYVLWGCLHGAYLVAGILYRKLISRHVAHDVGSAPQFARRLWTLTLVCFAWIFFRAQTVSDALLMISHLGNGWNAGGITATINLLRITPLDVGQTALILLVYKLLEKFEKSKERDMAHDTGRETTHKTEHGTTHGAENLPFQTNSLLLQTAVIFYLILTIAVAWLMLLSENAAGTFLYFQF
jgi:D-alanyl-lipoteichoic acid acyltransferase DltB (MBOAT superfamily)